MLFFYGVLPVTLKSPSAGVDLVIVEVYAEYGEDSGMKHRLECELHLRTYALRLSFDLGQTSTERQLYDDIQRLLYIALYFCCSTVNATDCSRPYT